MSEYDDPPQPDRRDGDDLSYKGPDRRKMTCGVLYTCYGTIGEVEDWLDDNCEADYELAIEGIADDLVSKSLKIMFEKELDKAHFIKEYAKKN